MLDYDRIHRLRELLSDGTDTTDATSHKRFARLIHRIRDFRTTKSGAAAANDDEIGDV
jgi:hypothetical protein